MDKIQAEIEKVAKIMAELESRGPAIEIVHGVDGVSGETHCGQGYIAIDEDITADWSQVTCVDCLTT